MAAPQGWHGGWRRRLLLLPLLLVATLNLCVLRLAAAEQIRYSVREELTHGAFVGNLVRDLHLDLGRLASRGFRVTSGSGRQYFDVNQGNGVLFVNDRVDREALCELRPTCSLALEVVIGNPVEVHNVEVEILDINDNAPTFPRKDYFLEISESALPGARFPIESAQDPDVGSNSVQTYKLSQSDHFALDLKPFNGNSKLIEIVLKKALDREQKGLHQLVLTAEDGGNPTRSGTAQISVRVVDTNDNPPVFDKSIYRVSLLENAPRGSLVVKLNATDTDEGSNGEVVYSFSSYTPEKVRKLFSIDPGSGEVRVNGTVDYEQASSYEIYAQATDKGPVSMAGHCKVLVQITDANDNVPEVVVTSLYSPVPENAQAETVVALLSVTDLDSGLNKQVTLSIPTNLPFKLNSFRNSYTLVTIGPLDREQQPAYNITLTATDSGAPPLTSQKIILVEVSDVNDNPPRFEESSYEVYVNENNAPGVSLCIVKAIDPDTKENAYVSYSLLKGDIMGLPASAYVSIKSDNGNMYAVSSFDYEKLREYQFVIQAQDAGSPPLSSTATVNLYVVDQNDHAPKILYPLNPNGSKAIEMIPRTASAGYLVTKVIAIDPDAGQNAWLFYYITHASDPNLFKMDLHTGQIRTTRKVGDDNIASYDLAFMVRDNGQPALTSSGAITVVLVDRASKTLTDMRRQAKSTTTDSPVTVSLIVALSVISSIFLVTVLVLGGIKWYKSGLYWPSWCVGPCALRLGHPPEVPAQGNNNIEARIPQGLTVQPHFIEVRGNGSLTKTYCYKACLTAGSGSDTFMFYNTGVPGSLGPHTIIAERQRAGPSDPNAQNLIIFKSEASTPNEPKNPNTDWRYSSSLRAGVQSAVHLEESAILRGVQQVLETQWPTVSSTNTDPDGGEVSPPVGAGVNCNSWTFKYGPVNPKQPAPAIPPDFPENFIIPGSPAIISIRQDQPSAQAAEKGNFITFGKKEEAKKKKKKKKGIKSSDKKEKGNSATDNSDQ